ncbi:hypothetical protein LCGC14_0845540 [marine sediment metagenome]|uniref:Uncharacterized protein n=1 Tax=marine sediment metagenome TaxID=412755 RepID=A0A0F9SJ01_9ZZZZ
MAIPDEKNPEFIFNLTDSDLLIQAVQGKIDLLELAKTQLINRNRGDVIGKYTLQKIHYRIEKNPNILTTDSPTYCISIPADIDVTGAENIEPLICKDHPCEPNELFDWWS